MAKKQVIRFTEGDLHKIIKESVNKVLKEGEEYVISENPMVNQLWHELMVVRNGIMKDVIKKYSWGRSSELGEGVLKWIIRVDEAIDTLTAVLQGTTADNTDYWDKVYHEQD